MRAAALVVAKTRRIPVGTFCAASASSAGMTSSGHDGGDARVVGQAAGLGGGHPGGVGADGAAERALDLRAEPAGAAGGGIGVHAVAEDDDDVAAGEGAGRRTAPGRGVGGGIAGVGGWIGGLGCGRRVDDRCGGRLGGRIGGRIGRGHGGRLDRRLGRRLDRRRCGAGVGRRRDLPGVGRRRRRLGREDARGGEEQAEARGEERAEARGCRRHRVSRWGARTPVAHRAGAYRARRGAGCQRAHGPGRAQDRGPAVLVVGGRVRCGGVSGSSSPAVRRRRTRLRRSAPGRGRDGSRPSRRRRGPRSRRRPQARRPRASRPPGRSTPT